MRSRIDIKLLDRQSQVIFDLAELLIDTVENGGSVSFMHPLSTSVASAFWEASLAAAERGSRVLLGAYENDRLVGTVTLLLDSPQNQPHRAEIAKLMTRFSHRRRGVALSLMQKAEAIAIENGRTLINLDTAADEGAAEFYERLGFQKAGIIPDYALKPHGGLTATIIYWKRVGAASAKT